MSIHMLFVCELQINEAFDIHTVSRGNITEPMDFFRNLGLLSVGHLQSRVLKGTPHIVSLYIGIFQVTLHIGSLTSEVVGVSPL